MNRRKFIQNTGLSLTAAWIGSARTASAADFKSRIGLQLYSLRDVIGKDPKKTLADVASYGYKELETYGYNAGQIFGMSVQEYAGHIKQLGMKTVSGHYGIDLVENDWDRTCSDAKLMGQEYVVVPYLDKKRVETTDEIKKTCAVLNKAAIKAKEYGLKLGYHNHAFEFKRVDGDQLIFDVMLNELDPALVSIELDLFWVVNAGFDPLKYFAAYPGRFHQWHVKDMSKTNRDENADVGTGLIDFKQIFAKAELSGMTHFYIEQESYPVNPNESVKQSIKNLSRII
jgi:sugar phosphate isomerase/epimerase